MRQALAAGLLLACAPAHAEPPAAHAPAGSGSASIPLPVAPAPSAAPAPASVGTVPENAGRAWGAASIMTGAVGLFAGSWLSFHAEAIGSRVAVRCVENPSGVSWTCPTSVQRQLERGRLEQRWGLITLAAGATLLGTGILLWTVYAPPDRSASVAAGAAPTGLVVQGHF